MAEEIEKEKNPMEQDYLEQIEKLKASTIDKSQYDKLLEENRKLLSSIVDGSSLKADESKEEKPDIAALRKDLFSEDQHLNNLQYWEKALELRGALIAEGQQDPFLPYGHHISPDVNDVARVENLVNVVKACIEYADGDSTAFTNELNRRTNEAMPAFKKGK